MASRIQSIQVGLWATADITSEPVAHALESVKDIDLVVSATTGLRVVGMVRDGKLDVVILDVGGGKKATVTAIDRIRKANPGAHIIMVGSVSFANVKASMQGLMSGADEFIAVPTEHAKESDQRTFSKELVDLIHGLGKAPPPSENKNDKSRVTFPATRSIKEPTPQAHERSSYRCLVIGSSTGGPRAVSEVLTLLGPHFQPPILIAQHMPAGFTEMFAQNIGRKCGLPVNEGIDGETIRQGHVYIAPGNRHMIVADAPGGPQIRLTDDPPINFCRPSVDPLFETAADVYKGYILGLVLTGMGNDGADGAVSLREKGGRVLIQDEETSVVWGMPGAVAAKGAADEILPISEIGNRILTLMRQRPKSA